MSKQKFSNFRSPSGSRVAHKILTGLLCAGLFWTATPALAQGGVDDPRLVVPVTTEAYPNANSVLMVDDIRFEVSPDRSHVFDEHDAVKVLTQDGVEENATLVRVVDLSDSKIEVLMARTIKADGRVLNAPPAQLDSLAANSKVYDSVKRFSLRFPEVEPGDVVEFHIRTTRTAKPDGHFWATTYVQNPMPIMDSTFTVEVPEGIFFRTATPGNPNSKPEKKTITKDGQSYQQLRWQISKEEAYEFAALGPKAVSQLKRIEVSSFKDWQQLSDYLGKEWQSKSKLAEGIVLRVAGWMPDSGDLHTRASALMRELNRKRKVAGFLGDEQDFHSPTAVFEEDLASGADASLLASVALNAAGIPNIPVVTFGVNSQSLEDELPIPEKVNKIILEIPRSTASPIWWDPELPGFVLETLPAGTSDTAALSWDPRFEGGSQGLKDLKMSSAFDNREELAVEGRLESSGRAELTLQFDRYGASGLNSRQAARDIQEGGREERDQALQTFFSNTARSYGPRARLLSRYFELDSEAADPFSLSFTVAVPDFAKIQDGTMLVPLPRFLAPNLRSAARERNRKTPLVFEQPYQQDVRIHLIFPEGSEVTNVPEFINETSPELEFFATGRAEANEVWYVGRLTVFDPWVEEQALQRSLDTLDAAMKSEDTIMKVELAPGSATGGELEIEEGGED